MQNQIANPSFRADIGNWGVINDPTHEIALAWLSTGAIPPVYNETFSTGLGSWVRGPGNATTALSWDGTAMVITSDSDAFGVPSAITTLAGLTPGINYRMRALVASTDPAAGPLSGRSYTAIGTDAALSPFSVTPYTSYGYTEIIFDFTASSPTHTLRVVTSNFHNAAAQSVSEISVTRLGGSGHDRDHVLNLAVDGTPTSPGAVTLWPDLVTKAGVVQPSVPPVQGRGVFAGAWLRSPGQEGMWGQMRVQANSVDYILGGVRLNDSWQRVTAGADLFPSDWNLTAYIDLMTDPGDYWDPALTPPAGQGMQVMSTWLYTDVPPGMTDQVGFFDGDSPQASWPGAGNTGAVGLGWAMDQSR